MKPLKRQLLFGVALMFSLGCNYCWTSRGAPTIQCEDVSMTIEPGTCRLLTNPCGDHQWLDLPRVDAFQFCYRDPAGRKPFSIARDVTGTHTTRQVCAAPDIGDLVDEPVEFLYGRGNDVGVGTLRVSTTAPLVCDTTAVTVFPGTCTTITNPCGDHQWATFPYRDDFDLRTPPLGVTAVTTDTGLSSTREICAAANVDLFTSQPVWFAYERGILRGGNTILLTTAAEPLVVGAAASPATIRAGATAHLEASASGGVPPYTYVWTPAAGLSAAHVPNPDARPGATTEYTVAISDTAGQSASASVTVTVPGSLTGSVTALPAAIIPGQSARLSAQFTGGLLPYTYSWSPGASLSSTVVSDPTATPSTTEEYTVMVTDAAGQSASASVTVTLRSIAVSANPTRVNPFESSQLSVGGVTGVPPFAYEWSPATTLDNPSSATPIAMPEETTTYTVRVTDATGTTLSGAVTVIVNLSLFVGAVPAMINQGATTQLFVSPQGGLPPYGYQWAPVATVSDPASAFPTATPMATTTYSVFVTDALGATASESVIVFVAPTGGGGPAGAPFAFTYDGAGAIAVDAAESASGSVRFEWDFSWVPGNPDLTTTNPQATWAAPPGTTGTITLTVTDAAGQRRSTTRAFP